MRKRLLLIIAGILFVVPLGVAYAVDGTMEGVVLDAGAQNQKAGLTMRQTDDTYVITPFESVSISQTQTWQDNRHRAYYNTSLGNVNGFLLFDVTSIPDDAIITSMTLRCYLENAYGSPAYNPVVDVYYSEDDGWTRYTAVPNGMSLDALLVDDIPFPSYVSYFDFVLDVSAHNWTEDLIDNQICIGFKNDVTYYSYVYFFGAYGTPTGAPPELTIETTTGTPLDVEVTLTPYGTPIIIPDSGGSFDYNIAVTNNETGPATFDIWTDATLPSGAIFGPIIGPVNVTLAPGTVDRDRTQSVPGGAPSGAYSYNAYVGLSPNVVWDSDSFTFEKSVVDGGGEAINDWLTTGESLDLGLNTWIPTDYVVCGVYPNPFNPTTTVSYTLPEAEKVTLTVHDVSGRVVARLVNGWREMGEHEAVFDGSNLASGVYFYNLTAGSFNATGKMVLMK